MGRIVLFSFLICILVALLPPASSLAVMSIDLGSEWMKIAIVSPGVPMEIVLNKESKRKTPVTIAFRDGERTFGEDAQSIGVRFPKNSYSYILDLLGKTVDNPLVSLFKERFPHYEIVPDEERGTVVFKHDSESSYTPEELLGMFLSKAKEFAEDSAGQRVNEAVIVVPGYFNQAERKAMLQAAELSGIKVLQLMNDYLAVALNYGIFRRKDFNETAQYIIFYDMGATSTTATVVSYQVLKTKEKGFVETNPHISVLGVGFDRTLGGLEIQLRLRDYLAKKFNELKKTPNDVFKNPRAMAKLFKEAGRLKNVLSANAEHFAQVEGLLDDVDFKLHVTRDQLEDLCSDLFERVRKPIDRALESSGLTMDVINQVILVGAGTRVPKIQEKLSEVVKMDLGKSLNTDEAAALGAVYKAADLSTGFKVKKFITKDAVLYPVQVVFEREHEGSSAPKFVKRMLFGYMNPYPQKKILTFNKHQKDFSFSVNYADLDHLNPFEVACLSDLNLSRVNLSGVEEAIAKNQGENMESKGIKVHFAMDESGVLNLASVDLHVEKTVTEEEEELEQSTLSKLGSTISKLFTGSDEKKDSDEKPVKEDSKEEVEDKEQKEGEKKDEEEKKPESEKAEGKDQQEEPAANSNTKKSDESQQKNATKSQEKKPKVVTIKEPIGAAEELLGVRPMSNVQLQNSVKKIEALNEFDKQRKRREGALNALESLVFETQNKLHTEEYQAASTEEEVEKIKQLCSQVSDWLYDEGETADVETYEAKIKELRTAITPLFTRVREHNARPEVLEDLNKILNASNGFLQNIKNISAQPSSIFTPVEVTNLEKLITDTQEWKRKTEIEQENLPLSAPPILTVASIHEKIAALDREVKYLLNKAKVWRPPKQPKEKDEFGMEKDLPSPEDGVVPPEEGAPPEEGVIPPVEEQDEAQTEKPTNVDEKEDPSILPLPEESTESSHDSTKSPDPTSTQKEDADKKNSHTEL